MEQLLPRAMCTGATSVTLWYRSKGSPLSDSSLIPHTEGGGRQTTDSPLSSSHFTSKSGYPEALVRTPHTGVILGNSSSQGHPSALFLCGMMGHYPQVPTGSYLQS